MKQLISFLQYTVIESLEDTLLSKQFPFLIEKSFLAKQNHNPLKKKQKSTFTNKYKEACQKFTQNTSILQLKMQSLPT